MHGTEATRLPTFVRLAEATLLQDGLAATRTSLFLAGSAVFGADDPAAAPAEIAPGDGAD
jgi:hypothetical protein